VPPQSVPSGTPLCATEVVTAKATLMRTKGRNRIVDRAAWGDVVILGTKMSNICLIYSYLSI
jgi:hypothetical protein